MTRESIANVFCRAAALLLASFSAFGQFVSEPVKLIPVGMDEITIFVPQEKCTAGSVCVSWIGYALTGVPVAFSPADPQFDPNLDENEIHRLSFLNVYSPYTDPLILQCQDAVGSWQNIQSPTGTSSSTVSLDANGMPRNFNSSYTSEPVFEQRWPGELVVNSTNCLIDTVVVSTKETTDWTYKRYRKSASFRVVKADGSVVNIMPAQQEVCRLSDSSQNLWQRSLNCSNGTNISFQMDFDEYIDRVTNYGYFKFNLNSGSMDKWACDYYASLDGVPINVNSQGVQQVFGRSTTDYYKDEAVLKGPHTLILTMVGTCYPTTRNCPTESSCVHNTNVVHWSVPSSGGLQGSVGSQRTDGATVQTFNFIVQ